MRSVGSKIIAVVAATMAIVSLYVAYSIFDIHDEHLREMTETTSRLAFKFDLAIREYMTREVRPRMYDLVGEEEFVPQTMSSSFATQSIFDEVREDFPRYILKFASKNPRNERNLATPGERVVLEFFEEHPEADTWEGEIDIGGRKYFAYFRARRAAPSCMRCHGKPQDAPAALVRKYGGTAGFYMNIGDVIGADTVAIPMENILWRALEESKRSIVLTLSSLVLCLGVILLSVHRIVIGRITAITRRMSDATATNDYSSLQKMEVRGEDEIDRLAESFNVLSDRLRRSYTNMEEDVRERTVKLQRANERLTRTVDMHRRAESALKKSERDLKKTTRFYRTILNSMKDAVAIVDADSLKIVTANDVFAQFYATSAEEDLEKTCFEVMKGSFERCSHAGIRCPLEETARTGKHVVTDRVQCTRADVHMPVEVSTSPMFDDKGKVTRVVLVIRDITARRAAEEDLREARNDAERATRIKSEFLANTSHEIRTPLNGIIGMIELAMDTEATEEQRQIFSAISTEAAALLTVIDDVLDFSKIEAGKMTLERISFNLHRLMEDLANSVALQAEKKGLEFNSYISPDVPETVVGDPGRVRQIVLNLTSNALKFTEDGEILIRTEVEEDRGDEVAVRIIVRDTGIGIPDEKKGSVFESFAQADGSTTRRYGGTGLGIPIACQMAELMGGSISFESREGVGSAFRISITLGKKAGQKRRKDKRSVELRGKTVLIVDDSRTSLSILRSYLGLWGCRIVEACGGREALGVLDEHASRGEKIDLMMTDFRMGAVDGFTLSSKVRHMKHYENMPIILLTTMGSLGDGRKCKNIGIQGYLTKPISKDELYGAIIAVLRIPMEEEKTSAARTLVSKHSIAEQSTTKNLSILVVEDYPTIQKILQAHLQEDGHQVDVAGNGREALDAFRRKAYDLILMDVQMPEMDGFDTAVNIRIFEKEQHGGNDDAGVPIIAVTARTTEKDRKRCHEAGMDDFLAKPVKRKALVDMVAKWSGTGKRGGADLEKAESEEMPPAPLDIDEVLGEFSGQEHIVMDALKKFRDDLAGQKKLMQSLLAQGEYGKIAEEAHSIKGAARFLAAEPLAAAALDLEEKSRAEREGEVPSLLAALCREIERLSLFVAERERGA